MVVDIRCMADNLTEKQRSYCMARVRTKDTDLEMLVRSELRKRGLRFRANVKTLPGKPDIVLTAAKVAIFIDGDFWHGYRFPSWKNKVDMFWREKIRKNRERDKRNFTKIRGIGWRVIRLWQHEIKNDLESFIVKGIVAKKQYKEGHRKSRFHTKQNP